MESCRMYVPCWAWLLSPNRMRARVIQVTSVVAPFYCRVELHCVIVPQLVYSFSRQRTFGFFPVFDIHIKPLYIKNYLMILPESEKGNWKPQNER